jgi:adenosylcobinamide-phosphate synthase
MTVDLVVASRSDLVLLAGAMAVDRWLGEPPAGLHPVVWVGAIIRSADRRFARGRPVAQLFAGAIVALAVPCLFAGGAALAMRWLACWPGTAGALVRLIAGIWLLKSAIALRALGSAARGVAEPLARGDLAGARRGLASLCSRDAAQLDARALAAGTVESLAENASDSVIAPLFYFVLFGLPGAIFYRAVNTLDARALAAGTVESLAENASDSVIAPLFYFVLFGLPGAIFYRAVNTLDAMIGYHGRYEYFGKAAARLDDLLNLVPARLTAALLLLAGGALGGNARGGWRILRRDGGRTESPNAGRPMAAMAGLLGVELEKPSHYRLGDDQEPLRTETIAAAWRIVAWACLLGLALGAIVIAARMAHAG